MPRTSAARTRLLLILVGALLFSSSWSASFILSTPQPPREPLAPPSRALADGFRFGASGDFGSVLPNVTSIALAQRANNASLDFLLGLGDLGYTTSEQQWCEMMKSRFDDLEVVAGNHDTGENGPGDVGLTARYCPWTLSANVVAAPYSPGYGFSYYFDYPAGNPLARFILVAPGIIRGSTSLNWSFRYWRNGSYDGGLANYDTNFSLSHPVYYDWTRDAILDARAQGIPWVIAGMHKMCITVGEKVACNVLSGTGQDFFDMLVSLKVDLILQTHEHNYQRSKQLALGANCPTIASAGSFNPACVVAGGLNATYPAGGGSVVVIQGIGGKTMDLVSIDGSDAEIGYFPAVMSSNANTQGSRYWGQGYVGYSVTNTSITAWTDFCPPGSTDSTGQCPAVESQTFHDTFTIRREDVPPAGPTARFVFSPTWPGPGATVAFNASSSTDPTPGTGLQFRWDWTRDGNWDTGWASDPTAVHAYGAPGTYTVALQVAGSLGRTANATRQVRVDGTPPVTTPSAGGTQGLGGWYRSPVDVTLLAADDLSGVASTTYRVDGGSSVPYVASFAVSGDGVHTVGYYSIDRAGNAETPKEIALHIDRSAPTTTCQLQGVVSNGSYVGSVNVSLMPLEATSGVDSTEYWFDAGARENYTGAFRFTVDGNHTLFFASKDGAGNVETTKSCAFSIVGGTTPGESLPPATSASLSGTQGENGWYVSSVTLTLLAQSPMGRSVTITYRIDGGGWQTYGGPFQLPDGRHAVEYVGTDSGGLVDRHAFAVKVDTLPPVITSLPRISSALSRVALEWRAADAVAGNVTYGIRVDGGPWVDLGTRTATNLSLADGDHIARLQASDEAGNRGILDISIHVDTNPFSFSGPYDGAPLIFVVVMGTGIVLIVILGRRRRRRPDERRSERREGR